MEVSTSQESRSSQENLYKNLLVIFKKLFFLSYLSREANNKMLSAKILGNAYKKKTKIWKFAVLAEKKG